MKVRLGFVSNSSASSFMIMGIELDMYEIEEEMKPQLKESEKIKKHCEEYYGGDWEEYFEDNGIIGILDEFFDQLDVEGSSEGESIYIGLSPRKMEEGETLSEFRERVYDELFKADLCSDIEALDWQEEAWCA